MVKLVDGVFVGLVVAGATRAQSTTSAPSSLSTGRPLSAPSVLKPSFTTLTTSVNLFPIGFTEFALSGSVIGTGAGESTTYALHQGTDVAVTLVEGPSGLSEHGAVPSVGLVVDIECSLISGSAFCIDTAVQSGQSGANTLITTASGPIAFTGLPILTASPLPTSVVSSASGRSSPSTSGTSSIPSITSPPALSPTPPSSGVSSAPSSSSSTTGSGSGRVIASGASLGIGMTVVAMVGSFVWTLL